MPSNFSDINALVIDNNSSMRKIMVSMLRVMGMKTVIVANSESQCMQKISITSADYQDFILIKVHNITEIPAEDLDNIAHYRFQTKPIK